MQGRAEKKWDREKKKKKLLVSILFVHNQSMYLTLLKEEKNVCFSLEMLHSWLVTHTYLTSFFAVDRIQHVQLLSLYGFLGGFVFGFSVFMCVCVPTSVRAAAAAQPWLVTQIFSHSGWKHHFDTWTDKAVFGSVPLQQFSPLWLSTLKCLCYKFSSRFPSLTFY